MAHNPLIQNGAMEPPGFILNNHKSFKAFYILPVAVEIKQMKPNIWKLWEKKKWIVFPKEVCTLHVSS